MASLFRTTPGRPFTKVVAAVSPAVSGYTPLPLSQRRKEHLSTSVEPLTHSSMAKCGEWKAGLVAPGLRFTKGVNSGMQVRTVHTDVYFPNMETYRRDSTKDPTKPARESEDERRAFTYLSYGAAGVFGLYVSKAAVRTMVEYKSMAMDQVALANTEVNISDIHEGITKTFSWRGKPVFVRHRPQSEIDKERSVDLNSLRDPQHDDDRVKNPSWVVSLGVCTHLGCVPIAGMGDFGGYYCPCHGSHYDTAGRIRKGPAPLNLEVPPYRFKDEGTIVIGETD